jgi:hypothetical protein
MSSSVTDDERIVKYFKESDVLFGIRLQGLRKFTKDLNKDTVFASQNSKRRPPE